jgi:hypothetical protein
VCRRPRNAGWSHPTIAGPTDETVVRNFLDELADLIAEVKEENGALLK